MMDQLQPYLRILKRNWWVIILTALSAFSLSLAASYVATPQYRTRMQFIVSPGPAFLASLESDLTDAIRGIESLDKRSIIATYEEIMNSRQIFEQAGANLQLTPAELRAYEATAVVLPDASALELTVDGPNPVIAAQIANTMGQETITYIQTLYNQLYTITVLDTAVAPSNPISPQPIRDAGVALVLGLALGTVFAMAVDYVKSPFAAVQRRRNTRLSPVKIGEPKVQDASSVQSSQI